MAETELLPPCAHCGGAPVILVHVERKDEARVMCGVATCGSGITWWRPRPEAIAAWNRRTPPSSAGWQPISTAPKDGSGAVAPPIAPKQSTRSALDIVKRLQPLTRQGEDYIWRPVTDAIAEIKRLRAASGEMLKALKHIQNTAQIVDFSPIVADIADEAIAVAEEQGIMQP